MNVLEIIDGLCLWFLELPQRPLCQQNPYLMLHEQDYGMSLNTKQRKHVVMLTAAKDFSYVLESGLRNFFSFSFHFENR